MRARFVIGGIVAAGLLFAVAAAAFPSTPLGFAHASSTAAGGGFVDSFSLSCTSAAAVKIVPPSGANMSSYTCQNASTTLLHVGDSSIADPGTTRNAPVYCLTNCPAQEFGGDVSAEYCRGDTDTTIYCRAQIGGTSPL